MSQREFDFTEGKRRRDEGIANALTAQEFWLERFLVFVEEYAEFNPTFLMEDVKVAWTRAGGEQPRHVNSWGAVSNVAAKRGIIRKTGTTRKVRLAAGHARLCYEWTRGAR